jgi:hypothetical protein
MVSLCPVQLLWWALLQNTANMFVNINIEADRVVTHTHTHTHISLWVRIGKSTSEMLTLLILVYDSRWFKEGQGDVQDNPGSAKNGQKRKVQIQIWTEYEPQCPPIED